MNFLLLIALGYLLLKDCRRDGGGLGRISFKELEADHRRINRFWHIITTEATRRRLDPCLLAAIIHKESQGHPDKKGGSARGLMQITENTARRYGLKGSVQNLFNPAENIKIGANYLERLFELYQEPERVISAYNAGRPVSWNQEYISDVLTLREYHCPKSPTESIRLATPSLWAGWRGV